jgi:hypothetical protein
MGPDQDRVLLLNEAAAVFVVGQAVDTGGPDGLRWTWLPDWVSNGECESLRWLRSRARMRLFSIGDIASIAHWGDSLSLRKKGWRGT